ncbi:MAG: efflux RND transporter permease subunit [Burkholderiaceae bacterium]|nr:efflux RND transporter permease subunit [Burkholderiaceae bacterium]
MTLSELCIRRPVMTVLLSVVTVFAGAIAYTRIPVAALPSFNTPVISVSASLPGASPENMASSVALPLEKEFSTIDGITVISSTNFLGTTNITLEFNNDRDIDKAAVDVQAALLRAQRRLPIEMTVPPSYRKVNPADAPVLIIGMTSPSMDLSELNDYAENLISPTLSTIDGVAQIIVYGIKRYAIRVQARLSTTNGERSIALAIQRQPNANTVKVVDAVKAMIPEFEKQLPASIKLTLINDRSLSIREAIHDVNLTLGLTVALVVLVIFLFLKHISATVIPSLSLPISLIGAFFLLYFMGYSLDNVSLLGITLAVGLVVDDSIVVLENIVRYVDQGMSPLKAALKGSREVGFTILSISLSLVAVFIPIFFMEGPIGLLFREFAVVVSLAIVVSAVVSLTLVPMLCSRYLPKPGQHAREFAINRHFDRWFEWTQKTYVHYLDIALQKRKQVLWLAVATFVITIAMFVYTPKGFFPEEDIGQITATTEADQDISFKAMLELQDRAAQIVANDPNVANFVSILGGGLSAGSNTGRFFIVLKPRDERESMTKVLEGLRAKFRDVPGLQVFMRPIQNLQLGGRSSKSRYQFTLQSVGFEGVNEWSEKLLEKLRVDPIFRDVTSDSQMKGLNVQIDINRDKAAQAGVTIADIRQALYNAFGQRQVSTIYTSVNTYYVILETAEDQRQFETDLNKVFLRGRATNQLIPLSSLASFKRTIGPTAVNHQGQIPAVTLSFNLAPDVALGEATDKIEKYVKEINLPPSIITSYGGDAKVFKGNQTGQFVLIIAALAVIYILLGVLYESYIHPITILAGLPSAAIGALLSLWMFGMELTIIATIGILMLIGIVKKNAILMIDFALDAQRKQKMSPTEAIRTACILRFRPIMMTTLAAIMGALPIALGLGAGAELRQPLGISVVGGLILSQFVTLFITPVIYLYLDRYAGRGPLEIPPEDLQDT